MQSEVSSRLCLPAGIDSSQEPRFASGWWEAFDNNWEAAPDEAC